MPPLGNSCPHHVDRISHAPRSLLFLCNGHGEDLITLRILQAIHRRTPQLSLTVLPLVGKGRAFDAAVQQGWLTRIGPEAALPSGGFSNQSLRGLLADVRAGLPSLSWSQWQLVCRLGHERQPIVAVGDLLPLLMAWSSGAPFGFIGTPKSDYTWLSGPGRAKSDCYHRLKGSEWDPWEWRLMRSRRCRLVAMRDRLTARGLQRKGVAALAPGNPMMDGLRIQPLPSALERCRRVLLLCGSRMPEAQRNLQRLVRSAMALPASVPTALLVAVGAQPDSEAISDSLEKLGFRRSPPPSDQLGAEACWVKGACLVLIGRGWFEQWAGWAEAGIATAGTATEQLVGLGIPALSLPGPGPQFKPGFARRQSRLLGGAVRTCANESELAKRLEYLLNDPGLRSHLGRIGMQRMGPAGGSDQLAHLILDRFNGY